MRDRELRSADHLAQTLVRSNLASPSDLEHACQRMPGHASAAELASLLVNDGVLTDYQASTALRNNIASLICGDYVILDKIGQGSMGQVFKAMHRPMERIVALKVLTRLASVTRESVERFRREAEVVASLDHPNIVRAFDARVDRKRTYLIMEFVDGVDLATLVEREGALPTRLACQYVLQAARGLAHAHQQGIVHRDVKPSNLIVDSAGIVKVLDLGVARLQSSARKEPPDSRLTDEGQVLGTVAFMAPEQAEDSRFADEKSDIYSLGCTLYFLLTGRLPFSGASIFETFEAHRHEPVPSLREFRRDASPRLQHVFERTVAKDPRHRFVSMDELIDELDACIKGQRTVASPVSPQSATTCGNAPSRWKSKRVHPSTETISIRNDPALPAKPNRQPDAAVGSESHWLGSRRVVVVAACLTATLILATGVIVYCNRDPAAEPSKSPSAPASGGNTMPSHAKPRESADLQEEVAHEGKADASGTHPPAALGHNSLDPPGSIEPSVSADAARQARVPPVGNASESFNSTTKSVEPPAPTTPGVASIAAPSGVVEAGETESPESETPPGFALTLITGKRQEKLTNLPDAIKRLESFIEIRERALEKRSQPLPFVATVAVGGQEFAFDDAGGALDICELLRAADPADDPLDLTLRMAGAAIDVEEIRQLAATYVQQQFPRHLDQWADERQRMPEDRDVRRIVMKIVALGKSKGQIPAYFAARFAADELDDLLSAALVEKSKQFSRDASSQTSSSNSQPSSALRPSPVRRPLPPSPPPRPRNGRPPR